MLRLLPTLVLLLAALSWPAGAQTALSQTHLHFKAAQFDPTAGEPSFGVDWTAPQLDARQTGAFVVQLDGRTKHGDRELIEDGGATIVEYIPQNAYLVLATPAQIAALSREARIRAAVRFQPAYKISPVFGFDLTKDTPKGNAATPVTIGIFEGADTIAATAAMRELGVEIIYWDGPGDTLLSGSISFELIDELAQIELVQWVQPEPNATYRNDTTSWVIQSNKSGSRPIWDQGIFGQDVIVGHIDGSIDTDNCYFDDPNNGIGPNHRKIVSHRGSIGSGDSHGTHTAGTVAGDQEPINGSTDDAGMAYHARLAHNNLSRVSGSNLADELELLYGDGARVFTNSWGNDGTSDYDAWAQDIDKFSWQNLDGLPVWAVTNTSNLRNPENAKNCLAVGATDQASNQDSHCTGGVGPTDDGRRKPEIYAPGCGIVSARQARNCSTTSSSGTSMACPAIAGAAALCIEYYENGWYPSGQANAADGFSPSAALVKATLLNATQDMTGVNGYPSNLEGWGRLKLNKSLFFIDESRVTYAADIDKNGGFDTTGQTQTHTIEVVGNSQDLEVTLVFTDKHASVNANFTPVNDLDLEVIDPSGNSYRGNVFSGGESTPGGSFDELNNVERVVLGDPELGIWTIHVHSANITTDKNQGYGLVANGKIEIDTDGSFETYGTGLAGTGGFVPTLGGSGTPNIGNSVTLEIRNGVGGAFSKTLIGFSRADIDFAGGKLLVSPPWIFVNANLGGANGQGGAGTADIPGGLPNDPTLVGAKIDFQTLIFDAGAPDGLAMTAGLEMEIGS